MLGWMIERGIGCRGYVRWFWRRVDEGQAFVHWGLDGVRARRSQRDRADAWARFEVER